MGFQHIGSEECDLAAFDFNRETWARVERVFSFTTKAGGAKGTTSALVRDMEVSCAAQ